MTQQQSSSRCSPRKTLNFRSSEVDTVIKLGGGGGIKGHHSLLPQYETLNWKTSPPPPLPLWNPESKDITPPLSPNMKRCQISVLVFIHRSISSIHFFFTDGFGDWSSEGCVVGDYNETDGTVTCNCNHLTSFSMLLVIITLHHII